MEELSPVLSICERFNRYPWHDSKFLTMHFVHEGDKSTGDLVLDLMLLEPKSGSASFQSAQLVLKDCTIIDIKLDVEAKAACGHDIAGAHCERHSAFMQQLERGELKHEANPFDGFVHFRLMLCPPSGEVHAIARDFEMRMSPP